jgi:glyoxylase-like metal-dependent hydrolase (beta-lactamase superfamily II)
VFGCTTNHTLAVDPHVEHVALAGAEVVELGNTVVTAIATPGHAPGHHAYAVADRRRGARSRGLCSAAIRS